MHQALVAGTAVLTRPGALLHTFDEKLYCCLRKDVFLTCSFLLILRSQHPLCCRAIGEAFIIVMAASGGAHISASLSPMPLNLPSKMYTKSQTVFTCLLALQLFAHEGAILRSLFGALPYLS